MSVSALHCERNFSSRRAMFFYINYVLSIFLLTKDVHSARILGLFPHPGRSHQMVFEPLLQKLAERGHHVTVVSFFPLENPPANYTDVTLQGIAPIGTEGVDFKKFEEAYRIPVIGKSLARLGTFFMMATNLCEKLVSLPQITETLSREYDVVLVENFNSDCMLGLLHVYGVKAPVVALSSCSLMPWSAERVGVIGNPAYVPLLSTHFTTKMNYFERLENTLQYLYMKYWYRTAIQKKEQEVIENHFGLKIMDLQELALNTSLILVNTYHSLNGIRPYVPGVVEVGGMHLDPNPKPIPSFMEKFLNESTHGVIIFSWGARLKTSSIPKYKEDILVNVLSKVKQRVIWKYEGMGPEGSLTGNILRVNWIPQYQLLQHKKVVAFIGHGGLLGMTEAISVGKPMVIVPFFGDQPQNAAAATAVGLATVLEYPEINDETFKAALDKVLSEEMQLSAIQASRIWNDRPTKPLDTAVYWTERVARWGSAAPLHSVAKEMSAYQILLLDVLATIITLICFTLFILYSIVKLFKIIIMSAFVKPEKRKVN